MRHRRARELVFEGMDLQALVLTFRLAAVTTAILLPLSLVLSAWLARSRSWVAYVVEAGVGLPLVLPPTVIGFYLLVLMGPATAPGRLLVRIVGHPLAFTFWGLVIGSVLYTCPLPCSRSWLVFGASTRRYLKARSCWALRGCAS